MGQSLSVINFVRPHSLADTLSQSFTTYVMGTGTTQRDTAESIGVRSTRAALVENGMHRWKKGQWLHRCKSKLIVSMLSMIKPFLDVHYGPLKGNHRYWFGALLLVRATILLLSALVPADRSSVVVLSVGISAAIVICFQLLVYRNNAVAIFNASFSVNLTILCIVNLFTNLTGSDFCNASNTLIGLAFIQFVGLVLFKVFSILKRNEKVITCFRTVLPEAASR